MKVQVTRLGHLGDGIAAGPIYVPLSLPGEWAEGEITGAVMAAPKIVTPSPDRVRPPCAHARSCGGCQLQHAADDFVARWKQDVVRQALAAQGLEVPLRPIATSPPASRRRATLAGRRSKKGVVLGFHTRGSDMLVAVPHCRLLVPELIAALPALEALVARGASRRDEVALTVTATAGGIDVAARGGKALDGSLRAELARCAAEFGLARLSWDGEILAQLRPPVLRFGAAEVVPPPGAFLQATAAGEAALVAAVAEAVGDAGRIVDLFAGCGTFALPLAARAEVLAVEGDAAMLAALDHGWRHGRGLKQMRCLHRDLFRNPLLAEELAWSDAAVIDPPRAGAEAQCAALAKAGPAAIAMVSCNPVTFARDARALVAAGYRVDWVQVVDQFRWSVHVELAAQFTRG